MINCNIMIIIKYVKYIYIYRVSQKKWGDVFWAHFLGVKWPQIKKWKIRDPPLKFNFTFWEGFSALYTACIHPCIHHVYYASEGYY